MNSKPGPTKENKPDVSTREPTKPRLSASVLLLNTKNEILMIQRTKESRTFAGMHAFPGGNHHPSQDGDDTRMTAIRELFEETGILLASPISHNSVPSSEKLARGRREIHSRTDPLTFPTFLQNNGLTVEESLASLIPFSQWTTPTNAKARYWTWFYVACLEEFPNILIAGDAPTKTVDGVIFDTVAKKPTSPTHDGHIEIFSTYFQSPQLVLESFSRGEISIMPPQFYLLTQIARLVTVPTSPTTSAGNVEVSTASRIRRIALESSFGSKSFKPRQGGRITDKTGVAKSIFLYEGDKDYERGLVTRDVEEVNSQEGSRHRSYVSFKEGMPATISVICDKDVLGLSDWKQGRSAENARL